MRECLFCLFSAGILTWFLTPFVRWLGIKFGIIDHPDHRKVHQEVVPCSGGLGIYLGFFGSLLLALWARFIPDQQRDTIVNLSFISALLVLLGIHDDKRGVSPYKKFLGQVIIVLGAIGFGLRINRFTNPFGGTFDLGWLGIPITLFWFLGFINTINLIDGLDGLSSGIVAITSLTLLLISFFFGDIVFSIMIAALAGTTLSFLRFNLFHKKKIFLGDNGSMLLGLLLGSIAIIGSREGAVFGVLLITLLCLGIPIYDTATAISRRLKKGVPVFSPDDEHLHHRLLKDGISQREAVFVLYGVTFILGLIGLFSIFSHDPRVAAIIIASGLVVFLIERKWWLDKLRCFRKILNEK